MFNMHTAMLRVLARFVYQTALSYLVRPHCNNYEPSSIINRLPRYPLVSRTMYRDVDVAVDVP